MISDEEKRLMGYYSDLGKKFYLSNQDRMDDQYCDLFEQIKGSLNKIENYKRSVDEIKNDLNETKESCICPSCGKEILSSSMFCTYCGTKLNI